jgi:glycosyltransferase involved in cell wall biosynthesis
MPPLVSVVIPVYNGRAHLEQTLRSVLAQTHAPIEIIVVDDASTDDSLALVAEIAPHALRLQQRNAGVSSARNRGLAAASGRHVAFLDQDDVWHPQQVERQVAWLEAHPACGAVATPYHFWHPQAGHDHYPAPDSLWPVDLGPQHDPEHTGWVHHRFLWDCWSLTSATLLRRDSVVAAGGFDVDLPYSEDWDLWLRLAQQVEFALLTWPPVLYRQHPTQGSRAVRLRDYRSELLLRYAGRYGLASADGRALTRAQFDQRLAQFQAEFAYHHLQRGVRSVGVRHMLAAWWRWPRQPRRLLVALAALTGWRPRST